jgi:Rrf2 family protein
MRISAKSEYGVRAMVHLARRHGQGPVPLSQVAEREKISLDFLEQLMISLRNTGLVKSVRGIRGGYFLAMPPHEVTVGNVMSAVEGPFISIPCLDVTDNGESCTMGMHLAECTTKDVWWLLQERVNATLHSITLADLCHVQGRPLGATATQTTTPTPPTTMVAAS